jgi:ABC-type Fe3+-hydroxamate transport system substrate-binding protein
VQAQSTPTLRIASLVPSLTELLVELGLKPWLVARTGYCIHPANEVVDIPKVGGTKTVNLQKLRRLAPSHVLVNVDENELPTVEALRAFVPHVVVTHPGCAQDNLALIDQIVAAMPIGAWSCALATRAERWKAQIQAHLAPIQAHGYQAQQVLYLIWRDPWMTVARDTYISRMLALVNWQTLPDVQGGVSGSTRYPAVLGTEAWLAEVQQVLLSSEPYAFGAEHVAEVQKLCPQATVRWVDGEALSWYGTRVVKGLAVLRQMAAAHSVAHAPQ